MYITCKIVLASDAAKEKIQKIPSDMISMGFLPKISLQRPFIASRQGKIKMEPSQKKWEPTIEGGERDAETCQYP